MYRPKNRSTDRPKPERVAAVAAAAMEGQCCRRRWISWQSRAGRPRGCRKR
ncbi:hypothetical protein FOQG_18141 [Fusarium oxysporum f. sp. raphani 54005]|uniref:Uncharacterized protein n=1 Tax=Fusarium oxysporum f. sp. raphani 54005 TaxID=1089458 RepID=X0C2Z1_FUSOX|nr:hypothetical protein FOWG_17851 [Fusarium oxysporum f. sp. lycopersici MN25]EXK77147.1 hypothetical protein FOQG_18141 [Fusarium oxysporum f. sp. raphani 54005]